MSMMARLKTTPAPVGGWNAADSLADMPETDAIILDNWFPSEGRVELRKGSSDFCTGLADQVYTLAEYNYGGTVALLAASGGNVDVITTGTAFNVGSGFSNDKWQTVQFDGKLGMVNGADAPQVYDGSTLGAMTISGTALTVSNLIGVNSHGSRTYFWEDNSQDFWYSAVNTLGGSLTKFPLSRVAKLGGKLQTMVSWTRDAGDGADDYAVFVMSTGECIVYQGTDPGSTFSMVGIYRIAPPIGRRCAVQFGGDVVLITKDGYVALSEVVGTGRTKDSIGRKVANAVNEAVRLHATTYGWQPIFYPLGNMLLFNVPTGSNTYVQHVVNTNTGAWCRFTDLHANCWAIFNDALYFGGNTKVHKFDDGYDDSGTAIDGDVLTAFQYLGSKALLKQVTAAQINLATQATTSIGVSVVADFSEGTKPAADLTEVSDGEAWDVAEWDVASWSPNLSNFNPWKSVSAYGRCFALRMTISSSGQAVYWYANTFTFTTGGAL